MVMGVCLGRFCLNMKVGWKIICSEFGPGYNELLWGVLYVTVVFSVVEICVDYGGVNVFHVCFNWCIVYGVGVCFNVCGVVCVVICCLFLVSGCFF